jgi:menaquinone-dependent protoporphyrinogen oxidase
MMSHRLLVTYASRAGSTAGVAEAIGTTLAKNGAAVAVHPMQDVHDITPYDAVVAGSAIQGAAWLPEALQFMQTHRAALAQKPCAIFAVCMTLAMRSGENYRPQVAEWLSPVRALVRPASEGLFAGSFDLSKVPSFGDRLKFRTSILLGVWPTGDHRDWNAIQSWAASLPPLLLA